MDLPAVLLLHGEGSGGLLGDHAAPFFSAGCLQLDSVSGS